MIRSKSCRVFLTTPERIASWFSSLHYLTQVDRSNRADIIHLASLRSVPVAKSRWADNCDVVVQLSGGVNSGTVK